MEQSKVVGSDTNVLSRIMWSMASKRFLDLIDFTSVIACIWMVFWLIYFNFVKDFIEILVYATFKYANRFRWLYRLFKLDILLKRIDYFLGTCDLKCSTEFDNFPPEEKISEKFPATNVSINNSVGEQFSRSALECTPCSSKNKVVINPRRIEFTEEPRAEKDSTCPEKSTILVAEKHILSCPKNNSLSRPEDEIFSAEGNIICSTAEYFDSSKNAISSSKSNVVIRSALNCESDAVFLSPDQESGLKENFFSWNINRIRDSFRKQSKPKMLPVLSATCKNGAEEIIKVQPTGLEDNERLIIINDSPVSAGCCNNLFITFRSKLQMKEKVPRPVHYKRF